jgi:hypothetical protein
MGKRGPKPKGEYSDKSRVLSTRIRADTRARLEAAAKATGRSLSQEIERRLRQSFDEDGTIERAFGSRRNYALMRLISSVIETLCNPDNYEADWVDDPYLFDQSLRAVNQVLEAIRPAGKIPKLSDPVLEAIKPLQVSEKVGHAFDAIQRVDPNTPLQHASARQKLAIRLKDDLGPLADRPQVFRGNAEQMRARAAELGAQSKRRRRKP